MQLVKGFVSNLRHTLYCLFLALTFAASQYYLIEDYFAFSPAYFGALHSLTIFCAWASGPVLNWQGNGPGGSAE